MKTPASKLDQRMTLILFPFKAYVAMGAPFLCLCIIVHGVVQPQYYGNPDDALAAVQVGYAASLVVLLPAATWQTITRQGRSAFQTWIFIVAGVVLPVLLPMLCWPTVENGR